MKMICSYLPLAEAHSGMVRARRCPTWKGWGMDLAIGRSSRVTALALGGTGLADLVITPARVEEGVRRLHHGRD